MNESYAPNQWEIWHARFNFDGSGYKFRPVLVISVQDEMLVIMISSSENKLALEHDYKIIDWQEAGLVKPSIARVDRIAAVPLDYVGTAGRIGKITSRDQNNLIDIINKAYF